jgi:hypothetical protein
MLRLTAAYTCVPSSNWRRRVFRNSFSVSVRRSCRFLGRRGGPDRTSILAYRLIVDLFFLGSMSLMVGGWSVSRK